MSFRVGSAHGWRWRRLSRAEQRLLLDEPTNNLDIVAKETLLEALRRFPGTVIIVSHDRHILNQLVTQVIEVGHGHAVRYLGNYDDYLAKKAAEDLARRTGAAAAARNESARSRLTQVGSSVAPDRAANRAAPAAAPTANGAAASATPSPHSPTQPAAPRRVRSERPRQASRRTRSRSGATAFAERPQTRGRSKPSSATRKPSAPPSPSR